MFSIRALVEHLEISIGNTTFEEMGKIRDLEKTSLSLFNRSSEDVTVKESEQWQYHIYKIISNKEELVYKKIFPFYSGDLKVF